MKRIIYLAVIVIMVGANAGYAQKKQVSDYNYQRANELHEQKGNDDEILALLDKQLDETPYHCSSLLLRSLIYLYKGKNNLALADMNTAIAHYNKKSADRSIASLYHWRAVIYQVIEETDKALADANTAYKLLKKDETHMRQSILENRAQLYCILKEYGNAEADYRQLLELDETNIEARLGMAQMYMAQEDYPAALALTDKCVKYDAGKSSTYCLRMHIYDKTGDTDKAIDDAVRYFELDDKAELALCKPIFKKHASYALAKVSEKINNTNDPYRWLLLRTTIHESRKDYASAIADYDRLEQEYGTYAVFIFYRGLYCYELGDHNRAIADMTRCIEMNDGRDYQPIVARADFYRETGRYEEAIADFTRGIELEPTDAYAYYKRGWCYELSGDDERALADYDAGIDVDKSYAYIYLMRGEMHRKYGNREKSDIDFEQVLQLDSTATLHSCRHYALHFLGRDDEAEAWMEQIIACDTTDCGSWYDKSCLMARMGRLDESVAALRRAFELGYRSFAHIEGDDDIDPIRDLPEFKALIEEYRARPLFVPADGAENDSAAEDTVASVSEVQMKKMRGGTYEVPCRLNDLPLKLTFDTGASTVSISSVEASFMLKNGYMKTEDIKGRERFSTATGEIHDGTTIRLREIKIGDAVLRNVDASVVHNQQAPLLLGQSVLERFGIITIDNINSKLIIKQ